jgi:hypothetical protein
MQVQPERQSAVVVHEVVAVCLHALVTSQHRQLLPSQTDGKPGQPASVAQESGRATCSQGTLTAPASGGTFAAEPEQLHAPLEKTH